ncbi:hypothetical protein [Flavobacterium sp. UMI-01]|uniref:hypothetical protein n=1 Tax=Flavobacterium sp. UMI-01 TaxID=1441053 RepID=UPI001C7D0C6F|nr:hypothetical protein [Flavobacterium sp. UMI-01]GIZ10274.1 hypothetical protein FUMI01_29980 [Flavobacterium sp. UMI-01]
MLVQPSELTTELYPEIQNAITRGNQDEVISQIKAAEDFCKSYLFKYDLKALFGDDTTDPVVAPTVVDENLKKTVKVIASYWLVRKANPNVNLELFREDWELMIGNKEVPGWLYDIKEGNINPSWPYEADDPETPEDESTENDGVFWDSNKKRTQRF